MSEVAVQGEALLVCGAGTGPFVVAEEVVAEIDAAAAVGVVVVVEEVADALGAKNAWKNPETWTLRQPMSERHYHEAVTLEALRPLT